MKIVLFIAAVLAGVCSGCASMPNPGSAGAVRPAAPPPEVQAQDGLQAQDQAPTPEEVIARMRRSLESTPVLHVIVRDKHHGEVYECQGWHMGSRVRGEVRKDGKLVFASYSDGNRVQEYVPAFTFANKVETTGVLIEHETTEGGWFCLLNNNFTCGPGSIAVTPFLSSTYESTNLSAYLANMQPPTLVENAVLNERACYRYHFKDEYEPGSSVTWELFIDKTNYEPVRMSRLMVIKGKVSKDDVYDYTFKHLPDDSGIHWGLDVERLRKE